MQQGLHECLRKMQSVYDSVRIGDQICRLPEIGIVSLQIVNEQRRKINLSHAVLLCQIVLMYQ